MAQNIRKWHRTVWDDSGIDGNSEELAIERGEKKVKDTF
jgi:hypothetical protein